MQAIRWYEFDFPLLIKWVLLKLNIKEKMNTPLLVISFRLHFELAFVIGCSIVQMRVHKIRLKITFMRSEYK